MRITRILLVLVFLAVAAVYTIQGLTGRRPADDVPPVLTCDSEILEISVHDGHQALLSGITAADDQDGDITGKVLVTGISRLIDGSTARISYVVFDSDHNMATLTRSIRYTDYRLPRFSLEEPLIYDVGQTVNLLDRLHASDVVDGDITGAIRVTYTDLATDTGIHDLNVQVTNSMGDTAWLTVPVIIRPVSENRLEVTLDTYLLYLQQGDSFRAGDHLKRAAYNGDSVSLGNVTISGQVDTDIPGTYQIQYTCVYGSHTGTAILTVVVE